MNRYEKKGTTFKRILKLIIGFSGVAFVILVSLGFILVRSQNRLIENNNKQQRAINIASELRMSSEYLTRFARSYVITNEVKYKEFYYSVLDIRNGKEPRPIGYENIYWDLFVTSERPSTENGEQISLDALITREGFTEVEITLFNEAEEKSNILVKTEVIAFKAVENNIDAEMKAMMLPNESNEDFAERILFDEEYLLQKAAILADINTFSIEAYSRISDEAEELTSTFTYIGTALLVFLIISISFYITIILYAYKVLAKEYKQKIDTTEKLLESRKQLERAVDGAPVPIMLHAEDGEVIKVSNVWTEITGYEFNDIPTIEIWTRKAYGANQDHANSVISALYSLEEREHSGEFTFKTKDGHIVIWDFYNAYIGKLQDGRRMVMSVAIDVTERKKSDDIITQLASFPSLNPDPIIELKLDGSLLYINSAAKNIFPDLESLGTRHPFLANWQTSVAQLSAQESDTMMLEIMVGDCWYLQSIQHVKSLKVFRIYSHNITERKKLEIERVFMESNLRNQQKLESIGTLASGVAHEINNPINGVLNYGQLIIDSEPDDKNIIEYASEIITESNRIAEIVKNLLDFSRQNNQEHSYANIEDIISKTLSLINTVIKKDQIELNFNIAENIPQIKCRSQQIQQVLMNLITNARDALNAKYTGYNENKKINLSCTQYNSDGREWLKIIVEDFGSGISDEVKDEIFDPFFTTKGKIQGTGLGLFISFGIVKDHHGEMTFESEEGKFTRFIVNLPCDNGWEVK